MAENDKIDEQKSTSQIAGKAFKEHFWRFLENFIYLAICLSILETYRSLVLLQFDINQFRHGYVVAISASLVMAKLTVLSSKIKFFELFDHKPLIWPVLYRSFLMTVFVALFKTIEELIFNSSHNVSGIHAIVLTATHYVVTMFVFFLLFTVRGLDLRLGRGTLSNQFFKLPYEKKD